MSTAANSNASMPRISAAASTSKSSTDPNSNLISTPPSIGSNSSSAGSRHQHHNNNRNRNNNHGRQSGNGTGNGNGSGRRGGENLNHLLGFQLAPRARPPTSGPRRGSARRSASVPFNKERFVNAQYRFLVKPTGDYTALFADADIFLNWSDILQVIIPTTTALSATSSSTSSKSRHMPDHEGSTCPICLSKPVAPRMTKCGHVFCYHCILHYLGDDINGASSSTTRVAATANDHRLHRPGAAREYAPQLTMPAPDAITNISARAWKRCPICWDSVYVKDLKAVKWFDPSDVAREYEQGEEAAQWDQEKVSRFRQKPDEDIVGALEGVGQTTTMSNSTKSASIPKLSDLIGPLLSMRLIERPILTTLALPKSPTWPPPPSAFLPSSTNYTNSLNSYPVIIPPHSAPWHFQPDVLPFAKFMLATPELLLQSLAQDLEAIEEEKASMRSMAEMTRKMGGQVDTYSLRFVDMAENKVRQQIEKVSSELDVESVRSSIGRAKNDLKEFQELLDHSRNGKDEKRRTVSRKQLRKERDKERVLQDLKLDDGEQKSNDIADAVSPEPDLSRDSGIDEGLQQFLALKSQGLGGSYNSPLGLSKTQEQPQQEAAEPNSGISLGVEKDRSIPQQRTRKNLNPPAPSASSYLFYQAASGQPIYLNPLDIKILQSEFKSYSNFPENLQVKVSGSDEGSVNDELRKKHKYLSHLPMAADLVFVEVDWEAMIRGQEQIYNEIRPSTSQLDPQGTETDRLQQIDLKPIISRHTLSLYENALRQRKNKRRDRARREDKARSKAEGGDGFNREIREAQWKASLDGDPELGRSFDSRGSSARIDSVFGRSPRSETDSNQDASGPSPSFREQALWGAERHFETHPGGSGDSNSEDFPDALNHHHQDSGHSPALRPQNATFSSSSTPRRTVWGTQSFANQQRGGNNDFEDHDMDELWLELEEDYIVGNKSGNLKEGRGLNKQTKVSNQNHSFNGGPAFQDKLSTPPTWGPRSTAMASSSDQASEPPNESSSTSTNANQTKKKKAKKLILTSGGRGTG